MFFEIGTGSVLRNWYYRRIGSTAGKGGNRGRSTKQKKGARATFGEEGKKKATVASASRSGRRKKRTLARRELGPRGKGAKKCPAS